MNLKNYTSGVPAMTTISYIEAYLTDSGMVSGITKEIKDGRPVSIYFHTEQNGRVFTVRLPAQVAKVHDFLWTDYITSSKRPQRVKEDFLEQAERTAWKIQQDWVQVQMSLIKLKQADMLQVFMAYVWDGEQTFYERLKGRGFKQLAEKSSTTEG
jgi:hypothetical protein